MSVLVTKEAPDFTAQAVMADNSIKELSLKSYKGKYVLMFFYPLDFTFVCPSEIIAFDRALAEFKKRDCQILGISVDSQYSHYAWKNTPVNNGGIGNIQFPLIADLDKSISEAYDVLLEDGISLRGIFLIDREGIVRHQLVNDLPLGRSVEEALRVVDALQFTEKYGEVCPANWKPGEKAMKPTAEGVAEYLRKTNYERRRKMDKYECPCGYIYDPAEGDESTGIEPGTAFKDLPADWVCPVCGAEKEEFWKI